MKLPVSGLMSITTYSALHTFRENRLAGGTCLRMHWVKVHVASPCTVLSLPFLLPLADILLPSLILLLVLYTNLTCTFDSHPHVIH